MRLSHCPWYRISNAEAHACNRICRTRHAASLRCNQWTEEHCVIAVPIRICEIHEPQIKRRYNVFLICPVVLARKPLRSREETPAVRKRRCKDTHFFRHGEKKCWVSAIVRPGGQSRTMPSYSPRESLPSPYKNGRNLTRSRIFFPEMGEKKLQGCGKSSIFAFYS